MTTVASRLLPLASRPGQLRAGRFSLSLDRPLIMGVVNVTPDSFSDGGRHLDPEVAIAAGERMAEEGADILDVGGESTRPGATPLELTIEIRRIRPVVEALAGDGIPVSIDTMKPAVMRRMLTAGIAMINDVRALREVGAIEAVAAGRTAVCLMHMRGMPATMQHDTEYVDVVGEVRAFLVGRARACEDAGIARERIVVDPGFGFGKGTAENLALLRHLPELAGLGYPVLAGLSRKATIGAITGRDGEDRLAGSVAAALVAVARGASIVRVHDVRETVDALRVWSAVAREPAAGNAVPPARGA